jgi:hypothetical protein
LRYDQCCVVYGFVGIFCGMSWDRPRPTGTCSVRPWSAPALLGTDDTDEGIGIPEGLASRDRC